MKVFAMVKAATGKLILVILSVGITLSLVEFSIRVFSPQPINFYNFTLIQADGGGQMVYGAKVSSGRERLDGFGPYVPNLSTKFGAVTVSINSRGWRDDDYSLDKPEGVTRIVVLGDSVTFGYGVEHKDIFSKVLERKLNSQGTGRYEVISLGGAGSHTYAHKNMIRENVRLYDPDLVILAFNLNDILPNKYDIRSSDLSPNLHSFAWGVRQVRRTLDATFRHKSHLYYLVRERTKAVLRKFRIVDPTMVPSAAFDIESQMGMAAWQDTREVLLEIATGLEKDQVGFILAILPVEMQMSREIADIYRNEYGFTFSDSLVNGKPQEMIKEFANEHGIMSVDLLAAFREKPKQEKFFRVYGGSVDWDHPNPRGHGIIAEELEKSLASLPWRLNKHGRRPGQVAFSKVEPAAR